MYSKCRHFENELLCCNTSTTATFLTIWITLRRCRELSSVVICFAWERSNMSSINERSIEKKSPKAYRWCVRGRLCRLESVLPSWPPRWTGSAGACLRNSDGRPENSGPRMSELMTSTLWKVSGYHSDYLEEKISRLLMDADQLG